MAVVIHGGCWLSFAESSLARFTEELTERGLATWHIDYRKVDDPGGGWPNTFLDVAAGVDHLRQVAADYDLDLDRVVLVGHSAGGHLATWAAARPRIPQSSPLGATDPLPVAGVINIAGPLDMETVGQVDEQTCGQEVIEPLVGGTSEEVPARYAVASPVEMLPLGVPQLYLVGSEDVMAPYLEADATRAAEAGDDVRLQIIPGAGHHDLVAPWSRTWAEVPQLILAFIEEVGG